MSAARHVGRASVLLLAALALGTAAWLYIAQGSFVLERLVSSERPSHSDFDSFWRSARALLDGADIYRTDAYYPNLNPPLLTLLIAPVGLLEFLPAFRLFVLVTIVLVVGSMLAVAAELRTRASIAGLVTVAVVLSSPVIATLGLGQIYPLLMAGMVAAWIAERHGYPLLEGVAIGMVVAIKPSLVPVLLVPGLRRRWPTLGAAVVTGSVATVVGAVAAGRSSFPDWVRLLLDNPVQTYFDNAALPATLERLTSVNDWGRPLLEVPGGFTAGLVVGAVLLAVTAWTVRRPPADGGPDTALWAMAAAALLASPLTWHNYLMILMPGVLALIARGRWPVATLMLALAMIGMEWPPVWYGDDGTASALPLSLYCGILLLYWVALLPSGSATTTGAPSTTSTTIGSSGRHAASAVSVPAGTAATP